jgi:2-C-methyl-D-erythritol 2,4-cyclodiphosphate synthase
MFRTGFGFDTHKLTAGKKLMLGGVHIPHHYGCEGHSDADVLIHAICDALLGAANMRDIGYHFPDTDMQYKDKESSYFLNEVHKLITVQEWKIENIDTTVVIQQPKLSPYILSIQETLSSILQIDANCISVKAKTSENLGFIGRKEGISAYAAVLLSK